jgi:pimeloyl-[acyl-carrier protein] methyl ester esterase
MKLFIKSQGQGKPLILLHGWGFNGDIWHDMAALLSSRWCVYQVDLPGHGRSPMCEYRLPILTKTLATELPTNAVWIGWSLGGLLAMAVARWYPASVRALVLVSTSPRFITADDWLHAMRPEVLQQFALQLQNDSLGTLQRFLALQVKGSEAARQQLRTLNALLKQNSPPQPEALQAGLKLLQTTDLRSELSQISHPALLCLGKRDTIVPVNVGEDCQRWWPNLSKFIIKSAAHIPFLSHPDIFRHLLQGFLDELSSHTY